jgi:hypothetical protein
MCLGSQKVLSSILRVCNRCSFAFLDLWGPLHSKVHAIFWVSGVLRFVAMDRFDSRPLTDALERVLFILRRIHLLIDTVRVVRASILRRIVTCQASASVNVDLPINTHLPIAMQRHPVLRLLSRAHPLTTTSYIVPQQFPRTYATKRGPADYTEEDLSAARKWLANLNPDTIPRSLCGITFSRSSGPGGQNVNK